MNRLTTVVTVAVLLLVSTAAFGQYTTAVIADNGLAPGLTTARYMGMGSVGVAVADDAGAINYNPANLASLNIAPPAGEHSDLDMPWNWQATGTYELAGELDYWALHFAGSNPSAEWGFGASFHSTSSPAWIVADWWLVGIGARMGSSDWQWGVSMMDSGEDLYGDETIFNAGLLYNGQVRLDQPIRIGLTVEDITDEFQEGPFFSLGIGLPFFCGWGDGVFGADLLDATDQYDSMFNVGLEFNPRACENWTLGGGLVDTDWLTAGAGYNNGPWNLDLSWQESAESGVDDEIATTFSFLF